MKIKPFKAALGFLILFLSIVLLFTTSGFVSWSIWLFVWQFWPVLFVVFGAAFIMYRWKLNIFLGSLIFIIIFVALSTSLWITWQDQYFNTQKFAERNGKDITTTRISNEIPKNMNFTDVKIRFGESRLNIFSLPDSESGFLYDGTHVSNFFILDQHLETVGEKAKLDLKTSPFINKLFGPKNINEMNIGFSPKIEYSFDISTGSSNINLDFSKLKVRNLNMDAAASDVDIHFGPNANSKVDIKSGASSIKLFLPQDLGIKIDSKTALTSKNFADFDMVKTNSGWQSPNWNKSKNRVDIKFESGISKVELVK